MKKIYLKNKKRPDLFAVVDDGDFEKVAKHKWCVLDSNKNGKLFYAIAIINKKTKLMHRFLLDLKKSSDRIDHINGNGLDCRRANMRPANRSQQAMNRRFTKNKTGFMGVYKIYRPGIKQYQSSIRINGRNKSLGYFSDPKEASEAREKAAERVFGEFYRRA